MRCSARRRTTSSQSCSARTTSLPERTTPRCNAVPRVATEHAALQRGATCCTAVPRVAWRCHVLQCCDATRHLATRHDATRSEAVRPSAMPRRDGMRRCDGAIRVVAPSPLQRRSDAAATRPQCRPRALSAALMPAARRAGGTGQRRRRAAALRACDADATALLRLMLQARRAALRCNAPRRVATRRVATRLAALQHALPRCSAHVCAARAVEDSAVLFRGGLRCNA